jgi:hypothetical protein
MDLSMIETPLRGALMVEFGLMAVVGLAVVGHTLAVDQKIRKYSKIQQDLLNGIYDGWLKAAHDKATARQARLDRIFD